MSKTSSGRGQQLNLHNTVAHQTTQHISISRAKYNNNKRFINSDIVHALVNTHTQNHCLQGTCQQNHSFLTSIFLLSFLFNWFCMYIIGLFLTHKYDHAQSTQQITLDLSLILMKKKRKKSSTFVQKYYFLILLSLKYPLKLISPRLVQLLCNCDAFLRSGSGVPHSTSLMETKCDY